VSGDAHGAGGLRAAGLSYGELTWLVDNHQTSEIYKRLVALAASRVAPEDQGAGGSGDAERDAATKRHIAIEDEIHEYMWEHDLPISTAFKSEWRETTLRVLAEFVDARDQRQRATAGPSGPPTNAPSVDQGDALRALVKEFLDRIITDDEARVIPDEWHIGNVRATYGDVKRLRAALGAERTATPDTLIAGSSASLADRPV
jgi:hypothetical protein